MSAAGPAPGLELYRRIVETAEEGVWVIDAGERTTLVNQKMATLLGYTKEEMLGRSYFDFMGELWQEKARDDICRRRAGVRERYDHVLRHRSGRAVRVAMAASPIYQPDGTYGGALKIVSDVTAERQREALLATQRETFELLVRRVSMEEALRPLVCAIEESSEGVTGSVLLLSDDGLHVRTGCAPNLPAEFNRAIDGLPIGPVAGSCGTAAFMRETVIVDDIEASPLWAPYVEVARPHGLRACWSTPIFDRNGLVLGTFAFYFREVRRPTDAERELVRAYGAAAALVIEHVRLRQNLTESEERFRELADASSEGIALHEAGKILLANRAFAEETGYTQAELEKMNVLDLTPDEWKARVAEGMRGGGDQKYESRYRRKDGSVRWCEIKGRAAHFRGRPVRLITVRDVHDQKLIEEHREAMLREERRAREASDKAVLARDEFLAIASHELKTPLTPLKVELQLIRRFLRETFPEPDARTELLLKAVGVADQEMDRLGRLVTDLLDVTRISSGRLLVRKEPTDLAHVVEAAARRLERERRRWGSEVSLTLDRELTAEVDPSRFDQVVTNLLQNALKYGQGRPVEVSLVREGGEAVLRVRDHGLGILAEDQGRIFDRFFRVGPIENFPGLGLGLYISRQIVAAHGGGITVASEPGKGSEFTVRLPA